MSLLHDVRLEFSSQWGILAWLSSNKKLAFYILFSKNVAAHWLPWTQSGRILYHCLTFPIVRVLAHQTVHLGNCLIVRQETVLERGSLWPNGAKLFFFFSASSFTWMEWTSWGWNKYPFSTEWLWQNNLRALYLQKRQGELTELAHCVYCVLHQKVFTANLERSNYQKGSYGVRPWPWVTASMMEWCQPSGPANVFDECSLWRLHHSNAVQFSITTFGKTETFKLQMKIFHFVWVWMIWYRQSETKGLTYLAFRWLEKSLSRLFLYIAFYCESMWYIRIYGNK